MKNKAINTLNYTGIVTLSQYIKNKKVKIVELHNKGGASLFSFLANCLVGDFSSAKANWPTKVKLLDHSRTDGYDEYKPLSGFIFLRTNPEILENTTDSPGCRIRYSFMIPRDLLESAQSTGALGLGLYSHSTPEAEPENFAAYCELQNLAEASIYTSLLVDWELQISNTSSN